MALWRQPHQWLPRWAHDADISYALPPSEEATEILRVVIRESLSGDLLHKLIHDIIAVTEMLLADAGPSSSMSTMGRLDHAVRVPPGRAHRVNHKKQMGQGAKGKKAAYPC